MAVQAPVDTGFEKWQEGISKAVDGEKWDSLDCEIQKAVNEYNHHLSSTTGYMPLDWKIIKAMVWVETGANNSEWNSRPMQIGVAGDPGMEALLSGKEGGDLILPTGWKKRLTTESIRTNPAHNIRAGIGYLLMRMASFEYKSVLGADAKVHEVAVKPGDSLVKIAKVQGTTVDTLRKLNPAVAVLRPGQVLKYKKASMQWVITGWRHISTKTIAQRYNGGGDPKYAKKLDYVLPLVRNGKDAVCAQ